MCIHIYDYESQGPVPVVHVANLTESFMKDVVIIESKLNERRTIFNVYIVTFSPFHDIDNPVFI